MFTTTDPVVARILGRLLIDPAFADSYRVAPARALATMASDLSLAQSGAIAALFNEVETAPPTVRAEIEAALGASDHLVQK